LTVSNKHCPPGTVCVYDSTKGAITADAKNQVAAVMHYKEVEIVLEVMDVDLQIVAHTFRYAQREKQSSHFRET